MTKALLGTGIGCALLALVLLRVKGFAPAQEGDVPGLSAERVDTPDEPTGLASPSAGSQFPAAPLRQVVGDSAALRIVHTEGGAPMQGVIVTVAGAGPFVTDNDGVIASRTWPVGSTLDLELDVDADGRMDKRVRHVIAAEEPLALSNWLTLEVLQAGDNRAAFPIDSIGWSRRPGAVENVETTCELVIPMAGRSPWLRVPSKRLSLRSDWNLVVRSGAVVDARPAEQRSGRHTIEVCIVPVGSLRLELGTEEALNLQVALRWRGPDGAGPENPRLKRKADSVAWRDLPCGPYDIHVTSLNYEPWLGRIEVEVGANVLIAALQASDCTVVRCSVAYALGAEGLAQNLAKIDLKMQEQGGRPEPVTLERTEFDEPSGLGFYEGPAIRRGTWQVSPESWLVDVLRPSEAVWAGPALHFTAELPKAVHPSDSTESRMKRVRIRNEWKSK